MTPATFKSDKAVNFSDYDKNPLKCYCINGSIVNGVRESEFFSFSVDQPPALKLYKKPRMKHFKKINKPVLSHITCYLEDDDRKAVFLMGKR